jgi:hypothetical protein
VALTSPSTFMQCPNCSFSAKFPFEHIVLSRLTLPVSTKNLARKDITILEETESFRCRQCSYILALDDKDPLQIKAIEKGKQIKGVGKVENPGLTIVTNSEAGTNITPIKEKFDKLDDVLPEVPPMVEEVKKRGRP